MDLEKVFDTIDRHRIWQMLRAYGVRENLLKAAQSLCRLFGMCQGRNGCE